MGKKPTGQVKIWGKDLQVSLKFGEKTSTTGQVKVWGKDLQVKLKFGEKTYRSVRLKFGGKDLQVSQVEVSGKRPTGQPG